jgi:hypothetical protein
LDVCLTKLRNNNFFHRFLVTTKLFPITVKMLYNFDPRFDYYGALKHERDFMYDTSELGLYKHYRDQDYKTFFSS